MTKTLAVVEFAAAPPRHRNVTDPQVREVDAQASFLRILELTKRPSLEKAATDSLAIAIGCEFHPTWVELTVGYEDGSRSSCTVDTSFHLNRLLISAFGIQSMNPLRPGSTALLEFNPIKPLSDDD